VRFYRRSPTGKLYLEFGEVSRLSLDRRVIGMTGMDKDIQEDILVRRQPLCDKTDFASLGCLPLSAHWVCITVLLWVTVRSKLDDLA